ncbi:DNA polymerase IV [Halorhabdus amylolytica]|uniref:DNA polymerase IV n=1 Tax=Halorhabdus amylolytica TaxID=2559573 RepID=UPI0010AAF48B|nr:DNA polymerase IV [Halorhabdus amylolytica]
MSRPGRLPVETDDDERIVCHVDADCFYAACERLREPKLEGEPVVVGMGYEAGEPHGAVATASYEAREHGVESAQSIEEALEHLGRRDVDDPGDGPTAYYRPVDMDYYEGVSADVESILRESTDIVRKVSIDEAYLDVTERTDWGDIESFAAGLKTRIADEVGVTVSVGVAPTMSAAKIASDADKPDGLVVVESGDVRPFLAPMDVERIHNVGPTTARELREMGIETAGDLAGADPDRLRDRFGERGAAIYRYARGDDDREVTPRDDPKSLSRESAFPEPVEDFERICKRVRTLAAAVAERASRNGALYGTIGIKVVEPPFDVRTRARSLSGPVDDPDLLERIAVDLFREFEGVAVRKIGVRVSNLSFTEREQVSLEGFGDGSTSASEGARHDEGRTDRSPEPNGQTSLQDFS